MRESIETLSNQIRNQPNLDEAEKQELLSLLANIESEVGPEAADDESHPVQEVVRLAAAGAKQEAMPAQFEDSLLKLEASYPATASTLGRIAIVLARMGI